MELQHDLICRTIIQTLTSRGQTLAIAESCSGGLISEWMTRVSGASSIFKGGLVAYADEIKTQVLGVDTKLIQSFGAVSADVALSMAKQTLSVFNSDWAISVTGIAGPTGGSSEKPVGTVFIGIASKQKCEFRKYLFEHVPRQRVRELSAMEALSWFVEHL